MKNTKVLLAVMLIAAVIVFAGCTPEEINNLNNDVINNGNQTNTAVPKVKTADVFDVTDTQAYGGGEIISEGESAIVERGLCWSTTADPKLNDNHVQDSLGSNVFTCVMTDLMPATTYYVRAYAINGEGIGYGNQVRFTTLEAPEPLNEASFVGVWGVERIDYYNTDYYGEPIPSTMVTYYFTPGDLDDGIDLVFWEDNTGEIRDRSYDTIYLSDDQFIVCPDTTLITGYSYSYNQADSLLLLTMDVQYPITHRLFIPIFTDDSFVYVNEYQDGYVEKAYLKRLSYVPEKSKSTNAIISDRPFKKGPLLRR